MPVLEVVTATDMPEATREVVAADLTAAVANAVGVDASKVQLFYRSDDRTVTLVRVLLMEKATVTVDDVRAAVTELGPLHPTDVEVHAFDPAHAAKGGVLRSHLQATAPDA